MHTNFSKTDDKQVKMWYNGYGTFCRAVLVDKGKIKVRSFYKNIRKPLDKSKI